MTMFHRTVVALALLIGTPFFAQACPDDCPDPAICSCITQVLDQANDGLVGSCIETIAVAYTDGTIDSCYTNAVFQKPGMSVLGPSFVCIFEAGQDVDAQMACFCDTSKLACESFFLQDQCTVDSCCENAAGDQMATAKCLDIPIALGPGEGDKIPCLDTCENKEICTCLEADEATPECLQLVGIACDDDSINTCIDPMISMFLCLSTVLIPELPKAIPSQSPIATSAAVLETRDVRVIFSIAVALIAANFA